jgi:hypothetical protein
MTIKTKRTLTAKNLIELRILLILVSVSIENEKSRKIKHVCIINEETELNPLDIDDIRKHI